MANHISRGWTVEEYDGHLLVTFDNHTNAPEPFRVAFSHHGAAMFVHDLGKCIDATKTQVTFREAVQLSPDLSSEDKEHWLSICDKEGL